MSMLKEFEIRSQCGYDFHFMARDVQTFSYSVRFQGEDIEEGEDNPMLTPSNQTQFDRFTIYYKCLSPDEQEQLKEWLKTFHSLLVSGEIPTYENRSWEEMKDIVVKPEDRTWFNVTFQSLIDEPGFMFNDNYRVCIVGNRYQEEEYRKVARDGCCGFYDEIHESPIGTRYKIGFNFGH